MRHATTPPEGAIRQLITRLKKRGIEYGDVRWEHHLHEHLRAEHGRVAAINVRETSGIGVRVLDGGSWGFASTPDTGPRALRRAADNALAMARASSLLNRGPRARTPVKPVRASYRSPCEVDPFTVPLAKKLDYLLWANTALMGPDAIQQAVTHMDFISKRKRFVSTEGAHIDQRIIESGAGLEVVAHSGGRVETRSYPNSHHGALAQAGYEYVKSLDLVGGAAQAQREALQLLRAEPPKAGATTLILHPTQVVMQLHESCGHPTELDRALGHELSYAGGSFLLPEALGRLRYGSEHVTIAADATCPGGVGTFGYDDEGVPAQRVELVSRGLFTGYLSSRETAARIGLPASGGAMRAESWDVPPLIRMTNVNLEPGTASLDELLAGVKHGYLLSTNKSWSIDDRRLNFQFTTELGWEITDGKLGRLVSRPLYTGITPEFWGRCTGVGRREDWQLWGIPNCAKGEPMQLMHVGHGAPYARFDGVFVGPAT
ncbi:MAG TPA: TldD/PmbA family protein [bacterium]